MKRNMHKYEELTPAEFDLEKSRASIIYAAAGPMEYHEECNVLGLDPLKGYDWCLEAAEITGGIVFPMIPFAPNGRAGGPYQSRDQIREICINAPKRFGIEWLKDEKLQNYYVGYPSCYSSEAVIRPLYRELLHSFAEELGFKLCVFIGSHAPAGSIIQEIAEEENGFVSGMKVKTIKSLQYGMDLIQKYYAEKKIARIGHGGLWESAYGYGVNSEYFHPEYLDDPEKRARIYKAISEDAYDGNVRPYRNEMRAFSVEFARKLRRTTIERFAADVLKTYQEL